MFRYLTPIILTGAAIAGFLFFTKPILGEITTIKQDVVSYNEALDNAKNLESERDKLTKKFNSIDPDNLLKLQKFLPDAVDNIRLILESEKIASPYGMVLKNISYDSQDKSTNSTSSSSTGISGDKIKKDTTKGYGIWNLGFSTEGSYSDFISFTKDLESNLRIVDIDSVTFSSNSAGGVSLGKVKPNDYYGYTFKIKTYWLKN